MKVQVSGRNLTDGVKGKLKIFEFPSMPIEVSIEVPSSDKKWDPLLQQKLQEAAAKKIDDIEDLFTSEMIKIDNRLSAAAAKDPNSVNLADEQKTANNMSKQIADSLPGHVKQAVDKVFEELKKAHKELVKYQLKCAAKIAWASVKLSVAAARLGASHGADVSAWVSAGKEIYAIGMVIYELAKSADTVMKEVGKEYDTLIKAVAKVKKETNGIKQAARQIGDVEPKCKKVEEKVNILKPKVTGTDEKCHSMAKKVNELLDKADKDKGDLSPKAQAKAEVLATKTEGLIVKIEDLEAEVTEMRAYANAIMLTVAQFRTDYTKGTATTVKVIDFLNKAKALYDQAKEVVDVVKDIVDLAG